MKHGLTKRQSECLNFIGRYIEAHGYSPSYREIGQAARLASTSGVHRIVTGLEERGHVIRLPFRKRSLRLV